MEKYFNLKINIENISHIMYNSNTGKEKQDFPKPCINSRHFFYLSESNVNCRISEAIHLFGSPKLMQILRNLQSCARAQNKTTESIFILPEQTTIIIFFFIRETSEEK